MKKGDTVWHNGRWLTVANVERKMVEATPEPSPSPQPILEADLNLDLSETNGGRTFDVGRIAPCSEKAVLANGRTTTVGQLNVGDRVHLTGDNIGRVVSITKKWHTPTPPKYDTNGNGLNRVIATTKRMTDRLLYLYTSVELVKTTPEHPFAVKGKGYVAAGRLQPGDVLETQDGKVVTVERTEVHNEPQLVYNLEVENAHNFFVGQNAMLVHNGGDCVPKLSDPLPNGLGSRRLAPIREAYEDIKLGNGTPRIDPATGAQKVFQANELRQGGGRNRWQGALEWDVPGTSHRILQLPDGRLGYVIDHDYAHPRLFPSPWYPDGGK